MSAPPSTASFTTFTPSELTFRPWAFDKPTPEDVLEGSMDMALSLVWTSPDRHHATGYWTCAPVRLRLEQFFNETFHLVSGHVSYEVGGQPAIHLHPGDSIVMHEGDEAIFQAHEPSLVFWAVFGDHPLDFGLEATSTP